MQTAIQAASRQLPTNMPSPPTLRKVNPSDAPVIYLALQSPSMPLYQLDKYAENLLGRQLSTLTGVAQVNIYGSQIYAARVQIDPSQLAARGIGIDQVASAIKAANVNQATGQLDGADPDDADRALDRPARPTPPPTTSRSSSTRTARRCASRTWAAPSTAWRTTYVASWFNGQRAIVLAVQRQPGSNTIQIVDEIKSRPAALRRAAAATSVSLEILYDRSQSIRGSVSDVETTLIIAAVLVVMVIFLFLRTLSATLIPSLALPIAVIGTFSGMLFLGFSLDNLSLLALTLSVGFVVDDAIVMLENIVRHVEEGEKPFEATLKGSREIGFTILSMTASLAAVFIPIVFMSGMLGRLLHEFAVTIILAIVFSGIVSVTLTPLLCSALHQARAQGAHHGRFYEISAKAHLRQRAGLVRALAATERSHRFIIFLIFLGSLAATVRPCSW